jgi:hypothetical protein
VSDQNQILRLLATIREECAAVRSRQEELYEILISYKDQLQDLKQTVVEKLAGLPKSPYIAGQLVPAPRKNEGVDEFRHLLATYLHKVTDGSDESDERPVDFVYEKRADIKPDDIPLEEDEDDRPRRSHGHGGGGASGGGPRPRRDNDLERGPDRDIEPIDLDDDGDDDDGDDDEGSSGGGGGGGGGGSGAGGDAGRRRKRRRRGGRGRKKEGSGGQAQPAGDAGEASAPAGSGEQPT